MLAAILCNLRTTPTIISAGDGDYLKRKRPKFDTERETVEQLLTKSYQILKEEPHYAKRVEKIVAREAPKMAGVPVMDFHLLAQNLDLVRSIKSLMAEYAHERQDEEDLLNLL